MKPHILVTERYISIVLAGSQSLNKSHIYRHSLVKVILPLKQQCSNKIITYTGSPFR